MLKEYNDDKRENRNKFSKIWLIIENPTQLKKKKKKKK